MSFKIKKPNPLKTIDVNGFRKGYNRGEKNVIIPSGNISMTEENGFPLEAGELLGEDNLGNKKIMKPGYNYNFPGDTVLETKI